MEGAGAGGGAGGGREEIRGGSGGWRLVPYHSLAPYSAYRLAGYGRPGTEAREGGRPPRGVGGSSEGGSAEAGLW